MAFVAFVAIGSASRPVVDRPGNGVISVFWRVPIRASTLPPVGFGAILACSSTLDYLDLAQEKQELTQVDEIKSFR